MNKQKKKKGFTKELADSFWNELREK